MNKTLLILLISTLLAGAAYFAFFRKSAPTLIKPPPNSPSAVDQTVDALTGISALKVKQEIADPQLAVIRAKAVYQKLLTEDSDFSKGPCIAEDLMPDWIADVAHNPREPVDNQPENQCQNYRNGKAHHFVELDTMGEVIGVY